MKKALIGVALLALALPLVAQEGPVVDRAKQEITRFLGLGEAQVTKWDELLATREDAVGALKEQVKGLEEQLRALLGQPAPDAATVGALVIQLKGLRDQIEAANHTYLEGFEAVLTQEQTTKLNAMRHAARLEPLVPAFRLFGLVPPPGVQQPPAQ
jgi:Spy/CpxP family protein refolding chaperone